MNNFFDNIRTIIGLKQPQTALPTDIKTRERLVEQTLRAMNCEHNWEDEQDERIVAFDYQNGHFRIRVEKDSPYVRLMYLFFYNTEADNLQLVRHICNQCNLNSECERIVYSTNEEKNEVDIHAMSGVLLTESNARETLSRAMQSMFSWQNAFDRRFKELQKADQTPDHDVERAAMNWGHEMSLLREMEMTHVFEEGVREPAEDGTPVSLKDLAMRAFGLKGMDIKNIRIMEGPMSGLTIEDDRAASLSPRQMVEAEGGMADRSTAVATYTEPDRKELRTMMVMLSNHGGDDKTLYYRLTMTIEPLSGSFTKVPFGQQANLPQTVSVLIAIDLVSDKQRNDEFRYMWKEALEKGKAGDTDSMTDEQMMVWEFMQESLAKDLYHGRRLFGNDCFAEALVYLEHAFERMKKDFHKLRNSQKETFFEVCYLIGFCYSELRQYDRALYYLDFTSPLRRITYTTEMVNSMVNSHDFRAEHMVDSLINELESDQEDDEEEGPLLDSNVRNFYHFLRRRKVYLLIERESYVEVRTMLKKMLDEPENSDFAINELAYLNKIIPDFSDEGPKDPLKAF